MLCLVMGVKVLAIGGVSGCEEGKGVKDRGRGKEKDSPFDKEKSL